MTLGCGGYGGNITSDNVFFFFNDTATTEIYTLSLHDALPIGRATTSGHQVSGSQLTQVVRHQALRLVEQLDQLPDRTIAVHQLPQQPPPNGVGDKLQEPRWIHAPPTGHDRLRHTWTLPEPPYFNQNGLIYTPDELWTLERAPCEDDCE